MTQIHKALSHYWHLRDQGKSPSDAREHVRLRFGVQIDCEQPLASTAEVVRTVRKPVVGDRLADWQGDMATVTAVYPDGSFLVDFDDFEKELECTMRDFLPNEEVGEDYVSLEFHYADEEDSA